MSACFPRIVPLVASAGLACPASRPTLYGTTFEIHDSRHTIHDSRLTIADIPDPSCALQVVPTCRSLIAQAVTSIASWLPHSQVAQSTHSSSRSHRSHQSVTESATSRSLCSPFHTTFHSRASSPCFGCFLSRSCILNDNTLSPFLEPRLATPSPVPT